MDETQEYFQPWTSLWQERPQIQDGWEPQHVSDRSVIWKIWGALFICPLQFGYVQCDLVSMLCSISRFWVKSTAVWHPDFVQKEQNFVCCFAEGNVCNGALLAERPNQLYL